MKKQMSMICFFITSEYCGYSNPSSYAIDNTVASDATSCREMMPEIDQFVGYLRDEFEGLRDIYLG